MTPTDGERAPPETVHSACANLWSRCSTVLTSGLHANSTDPTECEDVGETTGSDELGTTESDSVRVCLCCPCNGLRVPKLVFVHRVHTKERGTKRVRTDTIASRCERQRACACRVVDAMAEVIRASSADGGSSIIGSSSDSPGITHLLDRHDLRCFLYLLLIGPVGNRREPG